MLVEGERIVHGKQSVRDRSTEGQGDIESQGSYQKGVGSRKEHDERGRETSFKGSISLKKVVLRIRTNL
jgi:hypothetical protein